MARTFEIALLASVGLYKGVVSKVMPTHTGKTSSGKCFAQWGSQKKYYYECGNEEARKKAVAKANKQGQAAHASGYKG